MLRPRFRKTCEAARHQYSAEFKQDFARVRNVMKSIQTNNAINGRVREIDPMPIEEQELGRGPITRRRITTVKLAADLQGSRRHIASDDLTPELR